MKNPVIFALAALIPAMLVGGSYVLADGRFSRGLGLGMRHFASGLQLTEEQRVQIKGTIAHNRENIRPLYRALKEKRRLLREAARAVPFDEALTRFRAKEVAGIQAEAMVARAQAFNNVLSVLTPDQRAKLEELRTERRRNFREDCKRYFRNSDAEG